MKERGRKKLKPPLSGGFLRARSLGEECTQGQRSRENLTFATSILASPQDAAIISRCEFRVYNRENSSRSARKEIDRNDKNFTAPPSSGALCDAWHIPRRGRKEEDEKCHTSISRDLGHSSCYFHRVTEWHPVVLVSWDIDSRCRTSCVHLRYRGNRRRGWKTIFEQQLS